MPASPFVPRFVRAEGGERFGVPLKQGLRSPQL